MASVLVEKCSSGHSRGSWVVQRWKSPTEGWSWVSLPCDVVKGYKHLQLIFFQQAATSETAFLIQTQLAAPEHRISAAQAGEQPGSAAGARDRWSCVHRAWPELSLQTSHRDTPNERSKLCLSFCIPARRRGQLGKMLQARASGKARGEQDPCKHPSRSPSALKRSVVPSRAVGTEDLPVTPGTCSLGHFSGSGEQQMKGLPPPEQLLKAQSTQEMQHVEGKVAVTVVLGQPAPSSPLAVCPRLL